MYFEEQNGETAFIGEKFDLKIGKDKMIYIRKKNKQNYKSSNVSYKGYKDEQRDFLQRLYSALENKNKMEETQHG